MSSTGMIQGERATLSGTIQSLVIDKTLMISGAAADSFAAGELARDAINRVSRAEEYAKDAQASALAAEAALTQAYTRQQVLSDATKSLFGMDASKLPDDVFQVLSSCVYMETGSYDGTGTSTNPGVVELTFNYPPEVLMIHEGSRFATGNCGYEGNPVPAIGFPQKLTTNYQTGLFYSYKANPSEDIKAKRSEDGKRISWYSHANVTDEDTEEVGYLPEYGFNAAGKTYNYIAFYRRDNA